MSKPMIRRVTMFHVRVPVPVARVNCPEYAYEPLQRGADGGFTGSWFGDVPFWVFKVEGNSGPHVGWGDSSRGVSLEDMSAIAPLMLGATLDDISPRQPMLLRRGQAQPDLAAKHQPEALALLCAYGKGLETAALDWRARVEGAPLWSLFGRQVRDRIRVEYWAGHRTPRGAGEITRAAKALGFKGLKLKGSELSDVPGIVKAVLDAGGPDFHLTIDPNGRWPRFEDSLLRAEQAVRINPHVMFEDVGSLSPRQYHELKRRSGIHIARTVIGAESVHREAAGRGVDGFNFVGPWHMLLAAAEAAEPLGIPNWLGSGCESGLADLASIHAGAVLPLCTLGSDLTANMVREHSLLSEPLQYAEGHALVPNKPGRGIDTDEDAVRKYSIEEPVVFE